MPMNRVTGGPCSRTDSELAKVGIEETMPGHYRCHSCDESWSVNFQPGGGLPSQWWQCPNGCNEIGKEVEVP